MTELQFAVHYRWPYWPDERPDATHWCHTRRQAETTLERFREEGRFAWAAQRTVGEWEDIT